MYVLSHFTLTYVCTYALYYTRTYVATYVCPSFHTHTYSSHFSHTCVRHFVSNIQHSAYECAKLNGVCISDFYDSVFLFGQHTATMWRHSQSTLSSFSKLMKLCAIQMLLFSVQDRLRRQRADLPTRHRLGQLAGRPDALLGPQVCPGTDTLCVQYIIYGTTLRLIRLLRVDLIGLWIVASRLYQT